jgi:transposase InsO family protein
VRFAFIDAQKASYPVTTLCNVLDVSESGYHAWRRRPPSKRAVENERITTHIKASFKKSRETYGSPRLTDDLRDNGVKAGRHRVARLMREASIRAKKPPRWKKTTNSNHDLPRAPNIVERRWDELATAPNKLWVSDLTYIWTWQGWVYLVVFLDVFSRKIVGWKVDETMEAHVVTDALKMAMARRSPTRGLILHSDQGSQYASNFYRTLIEQNGFQRSMSRKGDCWDNAIAESFFATIKGDLLDRRSWATRAQVEAAISEWIEVFYNGERRHSALGNVSPVDYERLTREAQAA